MISQILGPSSLPCSYLANQDIPYPVDDEASLWGPPLQLALPLPLQEAEEVLCVELQEVVQSGEQPLHRLQFQLHLLLQAFTVDLWHDAQRPNVMHLCLHQLWRTNKEVTLIQWMSEQKVFIYLQSSTQL